MVRCLLVLHVLATLATGMPTAAGAKKVQPLAVLYEILQSIGKGDNSIDSALRLAGSLDGSSWASRSIQQLASLNRHNGERDLHRWARKQVWSQLLPPEYTFELPVLSTDRTSTTRRPHAALLPHEVVGRLHAQAPELFEHLLTGGEGNLLQWWDAVAASPDHWYKQHPVVQREPNAALRIPIGLHGDEA